MFIIDCNIASTNQVSTIKELIRSFLSYTNKGSGDEYPDLEKYLFITPDRFIKVWGMFIWDKGTGKYVLYIFYISCSKSRSIDEAKHLLTDQLEKLKNLSMEKALNQNGKHFV